MLESKLETKVLEIIRKYNLVNKGEHVVLGLSGGPDSACLFNVLDKLQKSEDFSLHAVHVNHMLRSETNFRDEDFVKKMCASRNIPLHTFRADCASIAAKEGISSEEAGRNARYGAFSQVADELSQNGAPVKIAVAHNADDQAETIMYRIMRGTGTDGLAGMEHMRKHGEHHVIRPLLDVSREEIEKYCEEQKLEYVTDETNDIPMYDRNRIRLQLLPFIRENFNENISATLGRLASIAADDREYMWQEAETAYENSVAEESDEAVVLRAETVRSFHRAIRHRVILKGFRRLGLWSDISYERLNALDEVLKSSGATRVVQMPHGYAATVAFGKIYLRKGAPADKSRGFSRIIVSVEDVKETEWGACSREESEREGNRGENHAGADVVLDADKVARETGIAAEKLAAGVVLRARRAGDYIPLNGGNKAVRKLMAEMKIPADERDGEMLTAAGNCVLCISSNQGRRYAETLKVTSGTKRLLIVKFV